MTHIHTFPKPKNLLFDLNETLVHQHRTEKSHIAFTYAALTQYAWRSLSYEAFENAWVKWFEEKEAMRWERGRQALREGRLTDAYQDLREHLYRENIRGILLLLREMHTDDGREVITADVITEEIIEEVTAAFQRSWVNGLRPIPSSLEALSQLQEHYQLAIVTNFQQPDLMPGILTSAGLDAFFPEESVIISADHKLRKPHPWLFAEAFERLKIEADETAYIGDTLDDDMLGAKIAGMIPVLLNPDKKHASHSDTTVIEIKTLTELVSLLDSW